jgi:signal transduction histidine kinase
MGSQAIGRLERMAGSVGAIAPTAPATPAFPTQHTLDADLHDQRLRVVWFYSLGLGVVGTLWVGFWLIAHSQGWLGEPGSDGARLVATVLQAGVLGAAGWYAFYRCRLGRLRRATYTNVSALALSATINLALISNAEGAAVMIFAIAASLAALVIEGREWLWWGGILAFCALVGSLLHSFPLVPLVDLPPPVATASLISATSLGLAVPMALMWLFSGNLTASRAEAWALARKAADANHLAVERARQLEERTAQLQAKNAELNDFLYVVSHDLRAPLINLEGFSRALQDSVTGLDGVLGTDTGGRPARWSELRGEIEESLDFIVRSVGKMDFRVQGLLELSRIDSRPNLAEPVDVARTVAEIVDSLRYTIDTRGIAVRVDPLPAVTGDAVRIHQVFGNLIDNAVKYVKPQGEASIHIGCEAHNGTPHFFVRDSGIGIRPEDQAKIFRLFSRVGGNGVAGDGMGLTAVKKILEKHGGRIWVDSTPGKGSTFWFTLPGRDADEEREEVG